MEKSNDKEIPPIEPDLLSFLSSLMIEGLIFLGEIENPVTKKKEMNLSQGKYIIDLISLLKDKTKGNLTVEEATGIDNILYELRIRYIEKAEAAKNKT